MAKTKTFSTLDIYLASFLSLHNQDVILELQNGKVVFTFESTDTLYRLMNQFNSNEELPVLDYTTAIKSLRGKMLTKKEGIKGHGKGNGYGTKEVKL
jgi:hypothetical protein